MTHTLEEISQNPQNYKVCSGGAAYPCDAINWHENEDCVECYTEGNFVNPSAEFIQMLCEDIADSTLVTMGDGRVESSWEYIAVKV